jgi:polar amino acid transport system substrate-binding protein
MKNRENDQKRRLPRWLACILLALSGSAAAQPIVLTVLAQESIQPKWIFRQGRVEGICQDILAAIEKHEPSIRFAVSQSGRSLPFIENALDSGKAAVGCGLLDSPRRRSAARPIGKPLYIARQRLAALAGDDANINGLDDLVRLKALVNTARGSAYVQELKDKGIEIDDSTGDNGVNLRKILAGHGRFTYMNEVTLLRYIASEHLEGKVKMLPVVLRADSLYLWVSCKADPAAAPMLKQALAKIRASGELARIVERWSHP